ncbi:glycerophosphodiester phosphodiesterase [Pseudobacter ginsenosidimutans]|jgi:glycerophosphoryl diester phosphodiesterase|uniref:Glycerophosphoryl diester phosphodiesterase n=1 Tax=Pseudobacter ginsenosidimutans TaxID=661488 RepID=A0A4Q7M9L2_9BACT|nr:glycerophosphodiester phosphodiesterase family protein [Pseudobacter ginsenosidimutans]RZS63947.1 glycerophosphoryl diester phosphodiesterase [Pseudobacter ginsenosidimutans]
MKHIQLLLIACIIGMQAFAQFNFNGIVAHRCGIYNDPAKPENSIAALQEAMKLDCYAAEMDVHLTRDHVPIVLHDHDIEGLDVEKTDFKDLGKVRLSNGELIPTLDQFIKATLQHPRIKLWLDLKRSRVSKARDVLLAEFVADVIDANHAAGRMEAITPSFDALMKLKMRVPAMKLHYIGTDKTPETLRYLGIDGVNLQYQRYEKEYNRNEAREQGLLVGAYVIDDPAEMKHQLDLGVSFITTNKPALLKELLKTYKNSPAK